MTNEPSRSEYAEFLTSAGAAPPAAVSRSLLFSVHQDLHPSQLAVLSKLSLIHFFTTLATLTVCPQFGLSLTHGSMTIMHLFGSMGPYTCEFVCGSIFLGISGLAAAVYLRPEELRVLKRSALLLFTALALASFGIFICLGGALIAFDYLLLWLLGAVLAPISAVEIVARLRLGRWFEPQEI